MNILKTGLCSLALILSGVIATAQTVAARKVEDGGSGPCKAIVTKDASLPTFTIYRPGDLAAAVEKVGPLPVLVVANGGCGRRNCDDDPYNAEIASYGYILIVIGEYVDEVKPFVMPTFGNAEAGEMTEEDRAAQMADFMSFSNTSPNELIQAIDWIQKQNVKKDSEFYHMVDVDRIAAMGSSCGGLQALTMSYDSRVKCLILKNSGVFNESASADVPANLPRNSFVMGGVDFRKENLSDLRVPILYVVGGEGDVAYPNAMDDFERITSVPVVLCSNTKAGHEGTAAEYHGGTMAAQAVNFLQWNLRGDNAAREAITTKSAAHFPDCVIKYKNL